VTTTSAHATSGSGTAGDFAAVAGTGVLSSSNINVDTTTAATVNLLSTGSLVVTASAAGGYYTVSSGGAIVTSTASVGGNFAAASTISPSQSSVTTTAGTGTSATFTVNPTGVAGSTFQINGYTDSTKSSLTSVMTVTINGASVYGIPSPAKSYVSWVSATTDAVATTDTANANSTQTGLKLQAVIDLNDAYGNPVTTAGALTATVSSGANVALSGGGASPGNSAGSYSTAVYSGAPTVTGSATSGVLATITEATTGAGWAGTLTVAYNGITIATKSGTITGVVSKLTVTPTIVVHTNTQNYGAFTYQAYDAAGNIVVLPYASLALSSSDNTAAVTAIAGQTANSSTAAGDGSITGGTTAGTSNVVLKYTNTLGTVISSNSFKVVVGGAADSYTAKLDKSSYNQGDIATLTVKFLDSKGNPAASDSALYTVSGSAAPYLWNASIASPMLGQIGSTGSFSTSSAPLVSTYPTTEAAYQTYAGVVPDTTGSITIKFTVGSTGTFAAGNYNAVVDFPTVDLAHGSAQTAAYTLGSQGTSLNDVLKGIVSLIASINKQIAALAKLVAPAKKK
jgi:hypothetical protein